MGKDSKGDKKGGKASEKGEKLSKAEKEAQKKARKAEKATKVAKKGAAKARKELGDDDEEDIEVLLAQLAAQDAKKTAVTVSVVPERPSARANFTLTPLPSSELVMFGGEFNNGQVNVCFNELFRFTPGGDWKLITSPNTPPHRCSHQAVLFPPSTIYIFGGEFATNSQFHHYNDCWTLSLDTNKWSRVESRKGPSARSGHRMAVWRNYIVLFGGFHQSLTQDKWYGDTWLLDTRTGQWSEVVFPATALLPSARSGHQLHAVPGKDVILLYGGYSEVKAGHDDHHKGGQQQQGKGKLTPAAAAAAMLTRKTRSVVHTDMWVLRMGALASSSSSGGGGGQPVWERVRYMGVPPSPRLGFTMSMYRDRAILFGGVADSEGDDKGETLVSTFWNDLYSYDPDRRRWYALELRRAKAAGSRRAKNRGGKGNSSNSSSASGAGGDDDAVSLGSNDGDDVDDDEEEMGGGGKGKGGGSNNSNSSSGAVGGHDNDLDDEAYYIYVDGKLVKMEVESDDDEAEETGAAEGSEKAKAHDGGLAISALTANDASTATSPASSLPTPTPVASPAAATSSAVASVPASLSTPIAASSPAAAATAAAAADLSSLPPLPAPPGRMKASMWIDGHWLYVFGGISEGRQRETTWDDCWRIDLRERNGWEAVLPARQHEWKGDESDDEEEDDDEDDDDSGSDDEDEEEDEDEGEEGSGSDDDADGLSSDLRKRAKISGGGGGGGAGGSDSPHAARHARGFGRGGKELARIRLLREQLGLEDAAITPQPGEELRDFFARTASFWVQQYVSSYMKEDEMIVGKDLRRKAFRLARERYEKVWPQLQELFELEEEQRRLEAEKAKKPGIGKSKAR